MSQKEHPEFTNLSEFEKFLCRINREQSFIPSSMCKEYIGIFLEDGKLFEWDVKKFDLEKLGITYTIPHEKENDYRGKIVSHNHPSGERFTFQDIETWAYLEQAELRVVTWNNSGCYFHSIKPRKGKWPTKEDIRREYEKMGIIVNDGIIRSWLKPDDDIERLAAQELFVYKKEHLPDL
jgi:hypothetical protein